jgi:hypothetical protein
MVRRRRSVCRPRRRSNRMQRVSLSLLILLACLAAGPVHAGTCSNPTGNEADVIYNGAFHTYQFCNGTNWMAEGAIGSTGGLMLISTQTASNSASLQFTNLPTSYNTLFLNCTGLLVTNDGFGISLLVGEGATPTWETGAHYTSIQWDGATGAASVSITSSTTNTDSNGGSAGNGIVTSSTIPTSVKSYIDNVGSSSVVKIISGSWDRYHTGSNFSHKVVSGYWNNDTNPVTALELVGDSTNIASGTCSLYGMN